MGYINDFRGKLQTLIAEGKHEEAVKFAADTVLESYRNGLALGTKAEKDDVRAAERFAKRLPARSTQAGSHANASAPRRSSEDAITR